MGIDQTKVNRLTFADTAVLDNVDAAVDESAETPVSLNLKGAMPGGGEKSAPTKEATTLEDTRT